VTDVLRRLGAFVLLMLGITLVAFLPTEIVPSNAAATNLGEQAAADPEAVKAFEEHYGLDKPVPVRYLIYLKHLVHGDLRAIQRLLNRSSPFFPLIQPTQVFVKTKDLRGAVYNSVYTVDVAQVSPV
jgi:ABC-type dipeptide/oligopeptide/nickel transport system permease component